MARSRNPQNPACARCGAAETVSKGRENGRPCWRCVACGRSFGPTLGTPLHGLKTGVAEIIRALQVVLHRGSLRAAEEQTGQNCETIAAWIKRLGDHAEAITDVLARELNLSEVELGELVRPVPLKTVEAAGWGRERRNPSSTTCRPMWGAIPHRPVRGEMRLPHGSD